MGRHEVFDGPCIDENTPLEDLLKPISAKVMPKMAFVPISGIGDKMAYGDVLKHQRKVGSKWK